MTREEPGVRRARLKTDHGSPDEATRVARALEPDNTPEMNTRVVGSTVVTEIERNATGGLQATVDDYVVNLQVAAHLTTADAGNADGESTPEGNASTTDTTDT